MMVGIHESKVTTDIDATHSEMNITDLFFMWKDAPFLHVNREYAIPQHVLFGYFMYVPHL